MKFADFKTFCESKDYLYDLFKRNELCLAEGSLCDACRASTYKKQRRKIAQVGFVLKCSGKTCRSEKSIIKNSFFNNNKLSKLTFLAGAFIKNKPISMVIEDTGFNEKTVYKYFNYFRSKCAENLDFSNFQLGGQGIEVEIDETHLFTRKYHRGNVLASESVWIFGIFERNSKRVYLEVVPRRDGATLYNILYTRLLPGTRVFSDSWRGYNIIRQNFEVSSVNHRLSFVDPNDSNIHTNNIERLWRTLKNDMRGCQVNNYNIHLKEFMFRRYFFNNSFEFNLDLFIKLIQ
ncbi:hypothetical protein H312_01406 [Anncaliia algerae PRA339]|uniref:ISXO2-like transposase domain-containing protein n=1 Tax=Anncaliia algerae PRA339 TaxID=1288291 RepID=A0A059F2L3_9MICR|nr:hypothetical protein H312_01406 [Anncaliia algerae PRA339]